MKLNLGAGNDIRGGYVNHDRVANPGIDVVHDLNVLPWPWEDVDEIRAWAVFEHLRLTLAEAIDECARVLRPGGRLVLKVPAFNSVNAAVDPTHVWRVGYLRETFDFFDPERGEFGKRGSMYGLRPWRLEGVSKTAGGHAWHVRMVKR